MKKEISPIIRTIYLYGFAIVGLIIATVGVGRIVDVGLRAWVFTEADKTYNEPRPVIDKEGEIIEGEIIDYAKANRQRDLASAISSILVGVPLYLYHWSIIKREKEKEV